MAFCSQIIKVIGVLLQLTCLCMFRPDKIVVKKVNGQFLIVKRNIQLKHPEYMLYICLFHSIKCYCADKK